MSRGKNIDKRWQTVGFGFMMFHDAFSQIFVQLLMFRGPYGPQAQSRDSGMEGGKHLQFDGRPTI